MKNKLVVIGYLGVKTCFLNVSREEAIQRFIKMNQIPGETTEELDQELLDSIKEFDFDDSFSAYDAWQ